MTGGDIPVLDVSYVAGQDLSNYQFRAVYIFTDGTVKLCGTGNAMIGILQNDPPDGDIAVVRELGHSKAVMFDASNTGGAALKVADSAGRLGAGSLGTDVIVAVLADASSGGQGEIHDVSLAARTAQGTNSRAGQLTFLIPMAALGVASGPVNPIATVPLGFTGKIMDMYAVVNKIASTSGDCTAAQGLSLEITATPVTSLGLAITNANAKTLSHVFKSTGTAAANSFGPTDTLTIISTSTTTWSGDTGMLEVHVITN